MLPRSFTGKTQRVEEYKEHRALHRKVDGLTKTLEGIVERNPTLARVRSQWLWKQAKDGWKHDRHVDPRGWIRPLTKARKLMRLSEQVDKFLVHPFGKSYTKAQKKKLSEYEALCEELGVCSIPGIQEHAEILRRSEEAARPKARPSKGQKEDAEWAEFTRALLELREEWDPDYYVWKQVADVARGERSLIDASPEDAMDVVLALLLILDRSRGALKRVAALAEADDEDVKVGGSSRGRMGFMTKTHPPIREWAILDHRYGSPSFSYEQIEGQWDRLDSDMLALGECVVDLFPASGWEQWCVRAVELLEAAPASLMPSDLQRGLAKDGFPGTQKAREKLSGILRGKKAWPGRAKPVVLAKSEQRRLVLVKDWRAVLSEELGISSSEPAEPSGPF